MSDLCSDWLGAVVLGLMHARSRSRAFLIQADIRKSPFGRDFDLVGMFDVIEHIDKDQETLQLVLGALRPGGKLFRHTNHCGAISTRRLATVAATHPMEFARSWRMRDLRWSFSPNLWPPSFQSSGFIAN